MEARDNDSLKRRIMFVKGKGVSKEDIAFSIVLFQKPEYSRPGGPTVRGVAAPEKRGNNEKTE